VSNWLAQDKEKNVTRGKTTSQSYKQIGYEMKNLILKACCLDNQEGFNT
jgi:hypothetical protein